MLECTEDICYSSVVGPPVFSESEFGSVNSQLSESGTERDENGLKAPDGQNDRSLPLQIILGVMALMVVVAAVWYTRAQLAQTSEPVPKVEYSFVGGAGVAGGQTTGISVHTCELENQALMARVSAWTPSIVLFNTGGGETSLVDAELQIGSATGWTEGTLRFNDEYGMTVTPLDYPVEITNAGVQIDLGALESGEIKSPMDILRWFDRDHAPGQLTFVDESTMAVWTLAFSSGDDLVISTPPYFVSRDVARHRCGVPGVVSPFGGSPAPSPFAA